MQLHRTNTSVADVKQIQNSSYRALKNGTKLNDVFEIVKNFKKVEPEKPIKIVGFSGSTFLKFLTISNTSFNFVPFFKARYELF